jgi:hypothetical protein
VANFLRRIRKLESRLTDANGLVPRSNEWFDHWYRKIGRVIAGEENVDLGGMTLGVVDSIIGTERRETSHDEGD